MLALESRWKEAGRLGIQHLDSIVKGGKGVTSVRSEGQQVCSLESITAQVPSILESHVEDP